MTVGAGAVRVGDRYYFVILKLTDDPAKLASANECSAGFWAVEVAVIKIAVIYHGLTS